MKKILLGFTMFVSCLAYSNVDHTSRFGLGLMLGEPTGISGKYNIDEKQSIDFGVGLAFVDHGRFHLHADYLLHVRDIFDVESGDFDLHYGVGARLKTRDRDYYEDRRKNGNGTYTNKDTDPRLGVRVPVGLNYSFDQIPLELFVEIAAVLDVIPEVDLDFNAAIGARWYF